MKPQNRLIRTSPGTIVVPGIDAPAHKQLKGVQAGACAATVPQNPG
jgi:hypothetical protein